MYLCFDIDSIDSIDSFRGLYIYGIMPHVKL